MRTTAASITLLSIVALLSACSNDATQIVVAVDTTAAIPCMADALEIDFTGPASMDGTGRQSLTTTTLPATVTLVPESGTPRVTVDVRVLRGGTVVQSGTADVQFVDGESQLLSIVLDASCEASPCLFDQSDLSAFSGVPEPVMRGSCGDGGTPDGGVGDGCVSESETCNGDDDDCDGATDEGADLCPPGEACEMSGCVPRIDRYEVQPAAIGTFQSACTSFGFLERVLPSADDDEAMLMEMPFPFELYGEPAEAVWVADDGFVTLAAERPDHPILRGPMDDPQAPRPGISAFWDGLETSSEGICFALSGVKGAQRLTITWEEACFERLTASCSATNRLSFSVVLEEGTNNIYLYYGDMIAEAGEVDRARGLTATIGVANDVPVGCPHEECDSQGRCADMTPCGYTQAAFQTTEPTGVPNRVFMPREGR